MTIYGNKYDVDTNFNVANAASVIAPTSIPMYHSQGAGSEEPARTCVLIASEPAYDYEVANKKYVDDQLSELNPVEKVETTSTFKQVYAKDIDGTQIMIDAYSDPAALIPYQIPLTDANGLLEAKSTNLRGATNAVVTGYSLKNSIHLVDLKFTADNVPYFNTKQYNGTKVPQIIVANITKQATTETITIVPTSDATQQAYGEAVYDGATGYFYPKGHTYIDTNRDYRGRALIVKDYMPT